MAELESYWHITATSRKQGFDYLENYMSATEGLGTRVSSISTERVPSGSVVYYELYAERKYVSGST